MCLERCGKTGIAEGRRAEEAENTGQRKIGHQKVAVKMPPFTVYIHPRLQWLDCKFLDFFQRSPTGLYDEGFHQERPA